MPPLPGRRGTRRSLWKRAAAGLDELELEPWVSLLWSNNHFGEESTTYSPTRLDGGGEQDAARAGESTRATKSTAAEELAPELGEVAEKS